MNCPTHDKPIKRHTEDWKSSEYKTLVGYGPQEPGHNHDDNCRVRYFICPEGHDVRVSIINRCPACDWVGKDSCFCSVKVEQWPED